MTTGRSSQRRIRDSIASKRGRVSSHAIVTRDSLPTPHRYSIRRAPVDSPVDFDLQLFHDLWRIEPDSLKLLGCVLLGILIRIFVFPNRCGHNVMAASAIGALIDKSLHESGQRPEESGAFSHLG